MNPCRCGYFGDPGQDCGRAPKCATDYQAKIFGPLFDRIDLHVDVPAVAPDDLGRPAMGRTVLPPCATTCWPRVRLRRNVTGNTPRLRAFA